MAACERAIEASGLAANDLWAKYGPVNSEQPKTTEQPKKDGSRKNDPAAEALANTCLSKYRGLAELKNGAADAFEAARTLCERSVREGDGGERPRRRGFVGEVAQAPAHLNRDDQAHDGERDHPHVPRAEGRAHQFLYARVGRGSEPRVRQGDRGDGAHLERLLGDVRGR